MLEGYGDASKEGIDDEDILGDIADTFLEIERRKKEAKGEEFDDEDELEDFLEENADIIREEHKTMEFWY